MKKQIIVKTVNKVFIIGLLVGLVIGFVSLFLIQNLSKQNTSFTQNQVLMYIQEDFRDSGLSEICTLIPEVTYWSTSGRWSTLLECTTVLGNEKIEVFIEDLGEGNFADSRVYIPLDRFSILSISGG